VTSGKAVNIGRYALIPQRRRPRCRADDVRPVALQWRRSVAFSHTRPGAPVEKSCALSRVNANIHSLVLKSTTLAKPMNRAMHIPSIPAMSLAAQGVESCVGMGVDGFEQRTPAKAGVSATK
jgi:hypothetical protein